VSTGFDAIKEWFWHRRRGTSRPAEKVWRGSRSFIWSRLESNTCIIKCWSINDFQTIWRSLEWFKSKEIGCRTSWSRGTSKGAKWKMLLQKHRRKSFLHRIVSDEKWVFYNNPKHKKWCKPSTSAKLNIHGAKLMLCIWSAGCSILWVPTQRNYHWGMLSPTIEAIEPSIKAKTARLREKMTRQRWFFSTTMLVHMLRNRSTLEVLNWDVLSHPPFYFQILLLPIIYFDRWLMA